ncbi:MAG: glutamine synthetase family protein [SAR324 cluster bacterium]|nr:glutamine synthetase family protein [SAR324 cluster bacterium]
MDRLAEWIGSRRISEVECLTPDLTGIARGKIMPANKFLKNEGLRLPEAVFLQTVTGEWLAFEDLFQVDPAEIDMQLRPDPETICLVPWVEEPTAQVIHDCFHHDGRPVELSPRNVLRRVLKLYEDAGLRPVAAPELEFYLTKINKDPDYPLTPPVGRSGRQEVTGQFYGIDALNEFDPLFEEMYEYCEAQELEIDALTHEAGSAQMEINFIHGDPMRIADHVYLYKRTMRETAFRHKVYATFMAKPMSDQPGSSMHVHQSLVDEKTGRNLFANEDGSNSQAFLSYIAGLQKYLPSAMPLLGPNINSYRRLFPDNSAPINVQWGMDNRTVGLRVPVSGAENRRVENRLAGADANPYLALATTLGCGLLGIREQLTPAAAVKGSAYDFDYELPRNLEEALRAMEDCEKLEELFGEKFVKVYAALKRREFEAYFQVISTWEREYLLLNV